MRKYWTLAGLALAVAILGGCENSASSPSHSTAVAITDHPPTPVKPSAPVIDENSPPSDRPEVVTPHRGMPTAAFVLPSGYDEAVAGLRQNDRDLMMQAMGVLPPTNGDAQAIRVILAAALGDSDAMEREKSQLGPAGDSPYSRALADMAIEVSKPKPDLRIFDAIASRLSPYPGCALPYAAMKMFALKQGDSARAAKYEGLAASHSYGE